MHIVKETSNTGTKSGGSSKNKKKEGGKSESTSTPVVGDRKGKGRKNSTPVEYLDDIIGMDIDDDGSEDTSKKRKYKSKAGGAAAKKPRLTK